MFTLGWLISGVLLAADAQRDSDQVAHEVARRWIIEGEGGFGEFVIAQMTRSDGDLGVKKGKAELERRRWDCRIVWDEELPADASTGFRPTPSKARL